MESCRLWNILLTRQGSGNKIFSKYHEEKYMVYIILFFRVAATNLPQAPVELPVQVEDTPEVAEAKRAHYAAIGSVKFNFTFY